MKHRRLSKRGLDLLNVPAASVRVHCQCQVREIQRCCWKKTHPDQVW
jgi:hypothetical protein